MTEQFSLLDEFKILYKDGIPYVNKESKVIEMCTLLLAGGGKVSMAFTQKFCVGKERIFLNGCLPIMSAHSKLWYDYKYSITDHPSIVASPLSIKDSPLAFMSVWFFINGLTRAAFASAQTEHKSHTPKDILMVWRWLDAFGALSAVTHDDCSMTLEILDGKISEEESKEVVGYLTSSGFPLLAKRLDKRVRRTSHSSSSSASMLSKFQDSMPEHIS